MIVDDPEPDFGYQGWSLVAELLLEIEQWGLELIAVSVKPTQKIEVQRSKYLENEELLV